MSDATYVVTYVQKWLTRPGDGEILATWCERVDVDEPDNAETARPSHEG